MEYLLNIGTIKSVFAYIIIFPQEINGQSYINSSHALRHKDTQIFNKNWFALNKEYAL